jgi:hypothetical protein
MTNLICVVLTEREWRQTWTMLILLNIHQPEHFLQEKLWNIFRFMLYVMCIFSLNSNPLENCQTVTFLSHLFLCSKHFSNSPDCRFPTVFPLCSTFVLNRWIHYEALYSSFFFAHFYTLTFLRYSILCTASPCIFSESWVVECFSETCEISFKLDSTRRAFYVQSEHLWNF